MYGGVDSWMQHPSNENSNNGWRLNYQRGVRRQGGDQEEQWLDPTLDDWWISKVREDTGGNLGDRWNLDGTYRDTFEANNGGGRDFNTAVAMMAAGYFGGGALNNAVNGAGAAAGTGMTASQQAAMMAANGMTDAEIAAALGTEGAKAAGLSGVTGGTMANAVEATTLANGANNVNTAKPVADAGMKTADWIELAKVGTTVAGTIAANDANNDSLDAAKEVAEQQFDLSKDALDWYKKIYEDQAGDRAAANQRAQAISDAQLASMNFALEQARELDQYNRTTFRPVEQRLVKEAMEFDTAGRRNSAAASAAADVNTAYDNVRQANNRALARAGIAPGSAKALALQEDGAINQAATVGGAATRAVKDVEQQGWARMADVAGLGRGIASNQAVQQQIASATGNSSVANALSGLQAVQSGNGLVGQGYTTALNGMSNAGNLFNSISRNENSDFNALLNGIGGITNWLGQRKGT